MSANPAVPRSHRINQIRLRQRAVKPDYAEAYAHRGFAYARKNLYEQAIADYTKAIELKPDFAKAYNNRAWTYHLKGEDAKGLADAEKAVALAPKEVNFLGTRAEIYEKLGRRAEPSSTIAPR